MVPWRNAQEVMIMVLDKKKIIILNNQYDMSAMEVVQ